MMIPYLQIFSFLFLLSSCGQNKQPSLPIKSNDDSVLVLSKEIEALKGSPILRETEYALLYDLADRIKPYCDNFQNSDKSKLPAIYNFCAEMFRRRCYLENGRPYTIKGCEYSDDLIDCCLRAIPISKKTGDTLSLNYTNSLGFLPNCSYASARKTNELGYF